MKKGSRVILGIACILLIAVAWLSVSSIPSSDELQIEALAVANAYLEDDVFISAVPYLEEAVGYGGESVEEIEEILKSVYLELAGQQDFTKSYEALLENQCNRDGASIVLFQEAAEYYLSRGETSDALASLELGITKTQDQGLIDLYEANRYGYKMTYNSYEDVTAIFDGTIGVQYDGLWGVAGATGGILLQCQYDQVSTLRDGALVVEQDGLITMVDSSGNRLALPKTELLDFGNYTQSVVAVETADGWQWATSFMVLYETCYEELGSFYNGYACAKQDGKWGVLDASFEWYILPQYDEIIMDELGICYGQGAVFAKSGDQVVLLVDGEQVGATYEDACPFGSEGYAAVQQDGKWGFIDTTGTLQIAYQFDDALSFGQHLAAVQIGEYWGYISIY